MSSVEEFESILKELPTLKAPGVSGTRIKKLTELAVKNIDQESSLITLLYSNCKAAPSSHKLGTLYVVDSIVRAYLEEAKKQNQVVESLAPEGTFASGVFKISELIESLIDDALELLITQAQNIKISKLVDIWERAETFSHDIIVRIRQKHFTSTTPPGSPPRAAGEIAKPTGEATSATAEKTDSTSILLALASLAKTSSPGSQNTQPAENKANTILSQLSALSAPQGASQPNFAPRPQQGQGGNEQLIFNMLQQMQQGGSGSAPPPNIPLIPQQPPRNDYGSDRRRREQDNGYSRRNRSRSPPGNRYGGVRSPPRQHESMSYNRSGPGNFGGPQGGYGGPQGGFGGPQGGYGGPGGLSTGGDLNVPGTPHYRPRNVGFDQSLPQGSFKVLSRTLFIGGVPRNMDDQALAHMLSPFAEVQSVILNSERKHAFVKVYSRREAEQVIGQFNKDNACLLYTSRCV